MSLLVSAAHIAASYLLGALPLMLLLARMKGFDLRNEGDLHLAIWRKVGHTQAFLGVLGDILKGIIPVVVGRALDFDLPVICLSGLAAVAGQMWPVFRRFNGERGNSTGMAFALALAYYPLAFAVIPIAVGAAVRSVPRLLHSGAKGVLGGPESLSLPLAMLLGFITLPLASLWLNEPPAITMSFLALLVMIAARRLTVGVRTTDKPEGNMAGFFLNRLLFDRGQI